LDKLVPNSYKDFDWADKQFLEMYLCYNMRFFYREQNYWDPIGFATWAENVEFDFNCRLHNFENGKVRIMFGIENKPGAAKGNFYNSNPVPAEKAGGIVQMDSD
jgi:hypothetical protein